MLSRYSPIDYILNLRAARRARTRASADGCSPRVFYGFEHIPTPAEPAHGGIVKFQRMQPDLPNSPMNYNLIYLVSSYMLRQAPAMARASRLAGAKLVWNQNGVAFPAWHGKGWEKTNAPMREILHMADHVFYQSKFCKESADQYLGPRSSPSEILYNSVDTDVFVPCSKKDTTGPLTILAIGSHEQRYRVMTILETVDCLLKRNENVELLLCGRFGWNPAQGTADDDVRKACADLGIQKNVTMHGAYSQTEAVELMQKGDILLHTKCNDPCPGVVIEAMACGIPVVFSASGGTPELVGNDAGVGIESDVTNDLYQPPSATHLAEAVLRITADHSTFSSAARARAESMFNLNQWLKRHKEVFEGLLS
jgi:glycosyltransferase involved in cell wall biosynthesis